MVPTSRFPARHFFLKATPPGAVKYQRLARRRLWLFVRGSTERWATRWRRPPLRRAPSRQPAARVTERRAS